MATGLYRRARQDILESTDRMIKRLSASQNALTNVDGSFFAEHEQLLEIYREIRNMVRAYPEEISAPQPQEGE